MRSVDSNISQEINNVLVPPDAASIFSRKMPPQTLNTNMLPKTVMWLSTTKCKWVTNPRLHIWKLWSWAVRDAFYFCTNSSQAVATYLKWEFCTVNHTTLAEQMLPMLHSKQYPKGTGGTVTSSHAQHQKPKIAWQRAHAANSFPYQHTSGSQESGVVKKEKREC